MNRCSTTYRTAEKRKELHRKVRMVFLYSTLRENMMNDVLSINCLIKWKDIPICLVLGEFIGQEPAGSRWLIQASVLVNSSNLASHYLPGKPRECCSAPGPLWRLGCLLPHEGMSGAGRPWLLAARTENHTERVTLRGAVSLGRKMQPAQSSPQEECRRKQDPDFTLLPPTDLLLGPLCGWSNRTSKSKEPWYGLPPRNREPGGAVRPSLEGKRRMPILHGLWAWLVSHESVIHPLKLILLGTKVNGIPVCNMFYWIESIFTLNGVRKLKSSWENKLLTFPLNHSSWY